MVLCYYRHYHSTYVDTEQFSHWPKNNNKLSVWLCEELVIFALEMKYWSLFMSLCSFLLILYWRRMYYPLLPVFNRYWYFHIDHCLWFILQVYLKYIEYYSNHMSDFYFVNINKHFFAKIYYYKHNIEALEINSLPNCIEFLKKVHEPLDFLFQAYHLFKYTFHLK